VAVLSLIFRCFPLFAAAVIGLKLALYQPLSANRNIKKISRQICRAGAASTPTRRPPSTSRCLDRAAEWKMLRR
jgi:hypothetical protein